MNLNETKGTCKCGNDTFWVIEGDDIMTGSYVYVKCTKCKEDAGISASNYGDITTDLEA